MTHGDQAKAKAAKGSQASGIEKTSSKAGKGAAGSKGREGGSKEGRPSGPADKIGVKKQQGAGAEKSGPALPASKADTPAKEAGGGSKAKSRAATDDAGGFSNPAVANAFKRALKKYPNAFRKLTD